jgi:hypothetical protein
VAVGSHVLFVRDNGEFGVGHIDLIDGKYVNTEGPKLGIGPDWAHVVAVGSHVLFVRKNGEFAVGQIDEAVPPVPPKYVTTQIGPAGIVFTGVTHVVAACSRVFLSRADQFLVGHINHIGQFVITQDPGPGVGGTPGPFHVVAVGPRVLSVSPDKNLGSVMHFDQLGQFSETDSAPDFASDWTHVVAVA